MQLRTKIKLWATGIVIFLAAVAYGLLNMEFVQKKVFDIKADVVGSNRTVTFYTKMTGEKVASYSDKDVRFETQPFGVVSVWLGSQNKKVHSTMEYIIEDNK